MVATVYVENLQQYASPLKVMTFRRRLKCGYNLREALALVASNLTIKR